MSAQQERDRQLSELDAERRRIKTQLASQEGGRLELMKEDVRGGLTPEEAVKKALDGKPAPIGVEKAYLAALRG